MAEATFYTCDAPDCEQEVRAGEADENWTYATVMVGSHLVGNDVLEVELDGCSPAHLRAALGAVEIPGARPSPA